MERANVVIVGAGILGCAIASGLAARFSDVFVLEALPRIGQGASTRNSGVIHSGVYYRPGSLKARHCVDGARLTYEFCAAHGVPHRRTGKFIVATSESEEAHLAQLLARGRENGVEGLRLITADELRQHEPRVSARSALHVPSTGLLESERFVQAFAALARARGAYFALNARLESAMLAADSLCIRAGSAGEIETRVLVNAAGLFADEVAALLGPRRYRIYPCRGEYWETIPACAHWVRGLVYPAPDPTGPGLGVHFTHTLAGRLLVGPNARYIADKNDYERDLEPRESFCARAQKLLPDLRPEHLRPAYTGIRAKLVAPDGHGFADFIVERDPEVPRVIHLVGIESPGLTAAPSLARHVTALVEETLA